MTRPLVTGAFLVIAVFLAGCGGYQAASFYLEFDQADLYERVGALGTAIPHAYGYGPQANASLWNGSMVQYPKVVYQPEKLHPLTFTCEFENARGVAYATGGNRSTRTDAAPEFLGRLGLARTPNDLLANTESIARSSIGCDESGVIDTLVEALRTEGVNESFVRNVLILEGAEWSVHVRFPDLVVVEDWGAPGANGDPGASLTVDVSGHARVGAYGPEPTAADLKDFDEALFRARINAFLYGLGVTSATADEGQVWGPS